MKKSLIALAVAGAMTVPAIASADATLYGSFRMMAEKTDNQSASLKDNFTRIGVRGTVDLGMENTRGIYNWESGINTNSDGNGLGSLRYANMGLTGDWGTVLAGRLDHFTHSFVGERTDLFVSGNASILKVNYGNAEREAVFGESRRIDARTNNTLAYVSPNLNGLTLGAGVVMAGDLGKLETLGGADGQKDKTFDGYNLGAQYAIAGLTVGAGYGAVKTAKEDDSYILNQNLWNVGASYNIDAFTVAAVYEEVKDKSEAVSTKDKGYSVSGRYEVDGLGAVLAYSRAKLDNAEAGKRWQGEVYNRMGRGIVAAGYIDNNKATRGTSNDQFYVSYRLDF